MEQREFFGNDGQQALLKRNCALSELLQHDKRYSYYGRTVGITTAQDGDLDVLATLARLQGNSNCGTVPENERKEYDEGLRARGWFLSYIESGKAQRTRPQPLGVWSRTFRSEMTSPCIVCPRKRPSAF
ncbi:hypothetical protein [uncultured Shimia sp.]|uniref:hypothetical protein n=1 Tax=uncultured Shimia sp. TaxID=573152 RepID=UPI002632AE3A|nr:hypothetical protein [uncultured Shimia sp.]